MDNKYEEALEKARQGKSLDEIFPELHESEDEVALEFLKGQAIEWIAGLEHDIANSVYDGVKGHDPESERELERWKKALAWLEKQKEQKPAKWSEEDIDKMVNERARKSGTTKTEMQFYRQGIKDTLKSFRPQLVWHKVPANDKICDFALFMDANDDDYISETDLRGMTHYIKFSELRTIPRE